MIDLVRAQALISSGIALSDVARAFAVSPSYISQLISEGKLYPPIKNSRDQKWDSIEDILLDKTREYIETTTNPRALLGFLRLANEAIRRGSTTNDIQTNVTNNVNLDIVNINIPERARARLRLDEAKRVVAIDNKPVITIEEKEIKNLIHQHEESIEEQY